MLGLSSEYLMEALRRTQSCSSLRSNDSTSAYSRQGVDDQVSEPDSNSQNPAVAAIWQQLAESTTLPDSDDDDENQTELLSWHTAPSNQCPKDKIPLPSQNTDFMARRNMANRNMMRDNIIEMRAGSPAPVSIAGTPHPAPLIPESTRPTFLALPSRPRRRGRNSPNSSVPSNLPTQPRLNTLHKTACASTPQTLATCLLGPKINIVNGTTSEVYVFDVPLQMLFLFCGSAVIEKLMPGYDGPQDKLEIPDTEAERGGVTRVMRYMRRCCAQASTYNSSGEIRIPQGAGAGGIQGVERENQTREQNTFMENRVKRRISREMD
jgi:hypothetical protein